jgi:hypothetical protein
MTPCAQEVTPREQRARRFPAPACCGGSISRKSTLYSTSLAECSAGHARASLWKTMLSRPHRAAYSPS